MILISHRGNTNGANPSEENRPGYIDQAIHSGFDVEVDIWSVDGDLYLGHDEPQYLISLNWLNERIDKLWIHCKNTIAVERFYTVDTFNYFWHQEDTLTLTSKGYIWAYPGKQPIFNSIAVMPEIYNDPINLCLGVCSDYVINYIK